MFYPWFHMTDETKEAALKEIESHIKTSIARGKRVCIGEFMPPSASDGDKGQGYHVFLVAEPKRVN